MVVKLISTQKQTNNTAKNLQDKLNVNKPKTKMLQQWLHMEGGLKLRYSSPKPSLTEQNKYAWMLYALEMIDPNITIQQNSGIYDYIHVDEKWFYLTH